MTSRTLVHYLKGLIAQYQDGGSAFEDEHPLGAFAKRQEFIDELKALVAASGGTESGGKPEGSTARMWHAITGQCRTPNSILRWYERACELDLPISVLSVLLRHYAALKRYSCLPIGSPISLPARPPSSKATDEVPSKTDGSNLHLPIMPSGRRPLLVDDRESVRH